MTRLSGTVFLSDGCAFPRGFVGYKVYRRRRWGEVVSIFLRIGSRLEASVDSLKIVSTYTEGNSLRLFHPTSEMIARYNMQTKTAGKGVTDVLSVRVLMLSFKSPLGEDGALLLLSEGADLQSLPLTLPNTLVGQGYRWRRRVRSIMKAYLR